MSSAMVASRVAPHVPNSVMNHGAFSALMRFAFAARN